MSTTVHGWAIEQNTRADGVVRVVLTKPGRSEVISMSEPGTDPDITLGYATLAAFEQEAAAAPDDTEWAKRREDQARLVRTGQIARGIARGEAAADTGGIQ